MKFMPWLCLCVCLAVLAGPGVVHAQAPQPRDLTEALDKAYENVRIVGTFRQAMREFEKLTGVTVSVDWQGVRAAGVSPDETLTLRVRKATGRQLLDVMLAQASAKGQPLAWFTHEDAVGVSTQMRVLYRDRITWRRAEPNAARRARRETAAPSPAVGQTGLRFEGVPLIDVIEFIRRAGQLNIHVNWHSLQMAGVSKETPVELKASNITLGRLLDLVVDQLSVNRDKLGRVYWVLDEGVIRIATGDALNQRMRTRIFDVADLLLVVPNFEAPRIDLQDAGGDAGGDSAAGGGSVFGEGLFAEDEDKGELSVAEQRAQTKDSLEGIIKDAIGEEMWQPIGKGSIRFFGKRMIVTQSLLGWKLLEQAHRPN